MTETTTEQLAEIEGQADTVQVREGRWRTRRGEVKNIRPCEPLQGAHFVWPWTDGIMTFQDNGRHQGSKESPNDLVEYLGPIEPDKTQELPGYTPPEGWRVVAVGEVLREGDVIVHTDDATYATARVGKVVQANQRYIRPIEPVPVQVREGRWRTRGGEEIPVTAMPTDHDDFAYAYPWWDGDAKTWANNGAFYKDGTAAEDLVEYLGPIEQQPKPVPDADERIRELKECNSRQAEQQIEELRSEVSYVQNLLGTERRRVTQLEELVTSLRTINEAQEKAFNAAGKANTDLQHRLNVVAAEWAEQAETIRRLQIELDAAQQVPQAIADRFEEGWNQGTARAVETVLEWLQPIRAVDNEHLANETLQHLPQIMRHLTGLAQD